MIDHSVVDAVVAELQDVASALPAHSVAREVVLERAAAIARGQRPAPTTPSVQPPTREQIFDALNGTWFDDDWDSRICLDVTTAGQITSAVLAVYQQPATEQECGVCGRRYPASDTRGTCPVCWPGFGEHGQQPTPSAEPSFHEQVQALRDEMFAELDSPDHLVPLDSLIERMDAVLAKAGPAESVSIADMTPGVTACADPNVNRWYCQRRANGICPLLKCAHPSTIRDVTPPPAAPEEGDRE